MNETQARFAGLKSICLYVILSQTIVTPSLDRFNTKVYLRNTHDTICTKEVWWGGILLVLLLSSIFLLLHFLVHVPFNRALNRKIEISFKFIGVLSLEFLMLNLSDNLAIIIFLSISRLFKITLLHVSGKFYSILTMSHSTMVTDFFQECRKQKMHDVVRLKLPARYMLLMFVNHAAGVFTENSRKFIVSCYKKGKTDRLVKDLWKNKVLEKLNESVF